MDCVWEKKENVDPTEDFGGELFLVVVSLTPIVNVDMLIVKEGNILLSWRADEQCGAGWHLPGACVRLKETLEQILHVCVKSELGTDGLCDMKPVLITENIEPKRDRGRTYFISFLYRCVPVNEFRLRLFDNQEVKGHLGWFDHIPEHFLPVQDFYREMMTKILEQGD